MSVDYENYSINQQIIIEMLFKLKYPFLTDTFDIYDDNTLVDILIWFESNEIKYYNIEHRRMYVEKLQQNCEEALEAYLVDLNCPIMLQDRDQQLLWIIEFACVVRNRDERDRKNGAIKKRNLHACSLLTNEHSPKTYSLQYRDTSNDDNPTGDVKIEFTPITVARVIDNSENCDTSDDFF